jgi:hypothetical protein
VRRLGQDTSVDAVTPDQTCGAAAAAIGGGSSLPRLSPSPPPNRRDKLLLIVSFPNPSTLSPGSITLQLTVTDFLGLTTSTTHTLTIVEGDTAPQVSLPGGPSQVLSLGRGLKVQTFLAPESLCSGRRVYYSWKTDIPGVPPFFTSKDLLLPGPLTGIADGATFFAEVTASYSTEAARVEPGTPGSSTARVALTAVGSPLVAQLAGKAGEISAGSNVTLSAARSFDPDDPGNAVPLSFFWECIREDYPMPCFQVRFWGDGLLAGAAGQCAACLR